MATFTHTSVSLGFLALLAVGCTPDSISTEHTGHTVSTQNQLSPNRLVYNRLVYNSLAQNQLSSYRLSDSKMLYNSLDDIGSTPEGRELLAYVAKCAFGPEQVLVVEDQGRHYSLPGLLGLAPEWEHGALSRDKARLISACLLAHVNAFGVSVLISVRAVGHLGAEPAEKSAYPVYEATFFGDVFGDELRTYACLGSEPELAMAHSSMRAFRVCGDATADCEIEEGDEDDEEEGESVCGHATADCEIDALGYCRDVCDTHIEGYGWTDCWGHGVQYAETMSAFLHHDGGPGGTSGYHSCEGRDCDLESDTASAMLDCSGSESCGLTCLDDAFCTVKGMAGVQTRVEATFRRGATAEIECYGTSECETKCEHSGTWCSVDCTDAGNCTKTTCIEGAACALDCTNALACRFLQCDGPMTSCPGDVWVCNRDCP